MSLMFTVASLLSARLNMSVELHAASKMKKKRGVGLLVFVKVEDGYLDVTHVYCAVVVDVGVRIPIR